MSEPPIRIGHPDRPGGSLCGCCSGIAPRTVQPVANRPGLTAIAYRAGDHGRFKASMLAALSSSALPVLGQLGSREDDDFSIALIDAWAAVCDVLTFYQERHANEAYVGTATERLSIGELARLTGYALHPGSAAATDMVFTMEDPPGAEPDVARLTILEGTRVQSQPGPDETPQVFETVEPLEARVAWNAFRPRQDVRLPLAGTSAWLAGQATGLRPGDRLLMLHPDRESDDASPHWALRTVVAVAADAALDRTLVAWDDALPAMAPPGDDRPARLFALRSRASLFGHNAPHPRVLSRQIRDSFGFVGIIDDVSGEDGTPAPSPSVITGTPNHPGDWSFGALDPGSVPLDAVHKDFAPGGWVVLTRPDDGTTLLYRIADAVEGAQARFAISGTVTLLSLTDGDDIELLNSAWRSVAIHGASEELALADTPLTGSVSGALIELDCDPVGLPAGRTLYVTGADAVTAEPLVERAALLETATGPFGGPALRLEAGLGGTYERATMTIHGNVARATHGEGATEILGGGDPSRPYQAFALKQNPVTHLLAATESGVATTLELRIDQVAWRPVPHLLGRGPDERVFATALTDDGETVVRFGDGRSGARPPAGRDNIVADYRRGLGAAGNVREGQLSLPLDRPLGLKAVTNPIPAEGGDDPERMEDARRNAPLRTLTLGRVVSITDYRDFALGYPGIAKADARWIWDGWARRIVVTVAGSDGEPIAEGGTVHEALIEALRTLGDPLVSVDLVSYVPRFFRAALKVAVAGDHDPDVVLPAVEAALRGAFSFERRDFAQPVALSEAARVAHGVAGVVAVDIDRLYRTAPPQFLWKPYPRLVARPARLSSAGAFLPAELLTLHPDPLDSLEELAWRA